MERASDTWAVAKAHTRTVPSAPAVANRVPSGLKASANMAAGSLTAGRVSTALPEVASQSVTSPAWPAVASCLPLGLKATLYSWSPVSAPASPG